MRFLRSLVLPVLVASLPAVAADTFKIDAVHSEVSFKIRHLLSKTPGRFTKFQGTIVLDEKDLAKSAVEVLIDAASINTDNENRDKHLRDKDFFETAKFPTITFKSVSMVETAKRTLAVTGDLTMRGVTKRITIPMVYLGTVQSPFKDTRAGFEGSVKLNRTDFGITYGAGMLGEDVEISLSVEAVKLEAKK